MGILLLLIFIAALPVLPAYLWFRSHKLPITPLWFLLSLLAGAVSLLIAVVLQALSTGIPQEPTIGNLLVNIFIRIALTEETGRLLALLFFFWLGRRFRYIPTPADQGCSLSPVSFGAATGLLTGLGFAIIETASYGTMNLALLRAFTAAPLHGACGIRVGMGAIMLKQTPGTAVWRFVSAVAIHGMYNFMVISPGIPRMFPVLIAFLALCSSIQVIRTDPPIPRV